MWEKKGHTMNVTLWVLMTVVGVVTPRPQFLSSYTDETLCKVAVKSLEEKGIKSVCIPMQPKVQI